MSERLFSAALTDIWSWRGAIGVIGFLGLLFCPTLWRWLPASGGFLPRPAQAGAVLSAAAGHLAGPVLRPPFAKGFLLRASPLELGEAAIGATGIGH